MLDAKMTRNGETIPPTQNELLDSTTLNVDQDGTIGGECR